MELLANPIVLGLIAGLVAGSIAAFALGLWRSGASEASAGLQALCGLKWRDYAHLIEDLLRARGFQRGSEERRPGEDGFDLMMTRGTSRYLIECKNGAAHSVSTAAIADLGALIDHQGAEGAVLATTGSVDPQAAALAASRRVEILAGGALWRQIKPWVPHELRQEAEARARGRFARRAGLCLAIAVLAAIIAAALAPRPQLPATAPAAPVANAPAPAATPASPAALGLPPALPDASLTEEQLAARRASAALEMRGNPTVQNALWATRSTLVVSLHQAGATIPDGLFEEACRVLVQYEELRYTRVQIESPPVEAHGHPTVRWRQCL